MFISSFPVINKTYIYKIYFYKRNINTLVTKNQKEIKKYIFLKVWPNYAKIITESIVNKGR